MLLLAQWACNGGTQRGATALHCRPSAHSEASVPCRQTWLRLFCNFLPSLLLPLRPHLLHQQDLHLEPHPAANSKQQCLTGSSTGAPCCTSPAWQLSSAPQSSGGGCIGLCGCTRSCMWPLAWLASHGCPVGAAWQQSSSWTFSSSVQSSSAVAALFWEHRKEHMVSICAYTPLEFMYMLEISPHAS